MKTLIVTEKPSVAKAIASVISKSVKRTKAYYLADNMYVTWCLGHLLKLPEPEYYDSKFRKWRISDLPIIPEFKYIPYQETKGHLQDVINLMLNNNIDSIICATDAAREGELIFRSVYYYSNCNKPVKRLWISSMEPSAILNGLKCLKPLSEYDNLYLSAKARQEADWLVGINLSRLYSCKYNHAINVGRVQSPTLAMIVDRYEERSEFIPKPFYEVEIFIDGVRAISDKISVLDDAISICNESKSVMCKEANTQEEAKKPDKLYDLTSIQIDANKLFGYTAKQTLDILQNLYESGLMTYPRTNSRYLTEDQRDSTKSLISAILQGCVPEIAPKYDFAAIDIDRIINDNKVSDHHALLPTKQLTRKVLSEMSATDRNIALLVIVRLLESVYLPAVYRTTVVVFENHACRFTSRRKIVLSNGFLIVRNTIFDIQNRQNELEDTNDVEFFEGKTYIVNDSHVSTKATTPPALYTESDLLSAMTNISMRIEKKDLKTAMKNKELGTAATRYAIIESLIKNGYVYREKKSLVPTENGITIVKLLDRSITSPELTAEWESKLEQIAVGKLSKDLFMSDVKRYICNLIYEIQEQYDENQGISLFENKVSIGICPMCGKTVYDMPKAYSCNGGKGGCGFIIWKSFFGQKISLSNAKKLLSVGKTSLIKGFCSQSNKKFNSHLVLKEGKVQFEFIGKGK